MNNQEPGFKKVLVSRKGNEYLEPKILRQGPEVISKAILYRHSRSDGNIESTLTIKRFKTVNGVIEMPEDPKKDVSLDAEELKNLLDYLSENIEAFRSGLKSYFPIDLEGTDLTGEQVLDLLNNLASDDLKRVLDQVKTTPRLLTLANSIKFQKYKETLNEFQERLKNDYPETSGVNSWQAWLTENYWVFGSNYKRPIPKAKINIEGSMPDFIFPSIDGCVDGIDIKKPNIEEIIVKDADHSSSFYWSRDINKAIGQVVNYLYDMDENRLKLAEILRVNIARPRGIIIAGRSNNWTAEQLKAYRKLSFSLHGIEIITYDHLLERARSLISVLLEDEK